MPRFVILHHQTPSDAERPSHWDLMLETERGLRTWALESPPSAEQVTTAEALPTHRRAYLDYEGPISGNRGTVTRWDSGCFEWRRCAEGEVMVRVQGDRVSGLLRLTRKSGNSSWSLVYEPGESATVSPAR